MAIQRENWISLKKIPLGCEERISDNFVKLGSNTFIHSSAGRIDAYNNKQNAWKTNNTFHRDLHFIGMES